MRTSFVLALYLGVLASSSAKTISPRAYPACAQECLANANFHGCGVTDYTCLCTNHAFLDETSQCIYNNCTNPDDLKEAIETADKACEAAGVHITSTYTPTQSRTGTTAPSSTGGGSNNTVTPTGTTTSSSPARTSNAATHHGSSGAAALIGAVALGALAF